MRLPTVRGLIKRRILANYRVDADRLRALLPEPFRPQLVGGYGIAGICMIRLGQIRPMGFPAMLGVSSENAAHRIAVEWEDAGVTRRGVYIPRRDTSSRFNTLVGGRLFAGVHHHARFDVKESEETFHVGIVSDDGVTRVSIDARCADELPKDSIFGSLAEASAFFEAGGVGYSPGSKAGSLDGLELRSEGWKVEALDVERIESSFFDDRARFREGSAAFDCALLMRNIAHEWHEQEPMACACV
jgi:hypothetical protein